MDNEEYYIEDNDLIDLLKDVLGNGDGLNVFNKMMNSNKNLKMNLNIH